MRQRVIKRGREASAQPSACCEHTSQRVHTVDSHLLGVHDSDELR